ncbi:hypothetical protein PAESOLCIP111_00007 [Paenibacillus solanacearum]|uniref:GP-PDE domain-containing protein n=1 Tax=Paenibacillus solanacearum TaxID=2048548 RepID=A0A916JR77_9BACL|nr:glycerophosphodiester phosphodiesterase family protein [Paenibacillus solanacearum]CAG7594714.1 hypothetical protein PAESOLCIP111_00007 [Paenibacillus solanacearum]
MNISLIAHRCGTDQFPELTLAAARHSLDLGADYIEMDIRFTKDNVSVISHDKDALKLFGHPAKIRDLTAAQFLSFRYASDSRYCPLTLETVLASGIKPVVFHIKEGGEGVRPIMESIRSFGYEDDVVMGVTSREDIRAVKAFDPSVKVLAFIPSKETVAEFLDSEAEIIRLWEEWVDEPTVLDIHAAGKHVWVMAGSPTLNNIGYTDPKNVTIWKQLGINGLLINEVEQFNY